jgi:hypothetical protein
MLPVISPVGGLNSTRRYFFFAGTEGRLPSCGLLAWRCGNHLDLLFLGFLGFPIASVLAFGHVDLPRFDGGVGIECRSG